MAADRNVPVATGKPSGVDPDRLRHGGKAVARQQRIQFSQHPYRHPRPFIDQRGVELDQARPGTDTGIGFRRIADPARGDQRDRAAARAPELGQLRPRERREGGARQSARLAGPGGAPRGGAWRKARFGADTIIGNFDTGEPIPSPTPPPPSSGSRLGGSVFPSSPPQLSFSRQRLEIRCCTRQAPPASLINNLLAKRRQLS